MIRGAVFGGWQSAISSLTTEGIMVNHGLLSRAHVYRMVASKDVRVRHAAFALLEASNPRLRKDGDVFIEVVRFIWEANPSYDVYREFSKRHLFAGYKVHELIGARIKLEKQQQQKSTPTNRRIEEKSPDRFLKRLCNEIILSISFFFRKLKSGKLAGEGKYRA